jgi:hypothetical protein
MQYTPIPTQPFTAQYSEKKGGPDDPQGELEALLCGHVYHSMCVNRWAQVNNLTSIFNQNNYPTFIFLGCGGGVAGGARGGGVNGVSRGWWLGAEGRGGSGGG